MSILYYTTRSVIIVRYDTIYERYRIFSTKYIFPHSFLSGQPCRLTLDGSTYMGGVALTKSGKQCMNWLADTPHPHRINPEWNFPDNTVEDAAGYCRNPDGAEGPWCYTTDPDTRWEYCDVPLCGGFYSEYCIVLYCIVWHCIVYGIVWYCMFICGNLIITNVL